MIESIVKDLHGHALRRLPHFKSGPLCFILLFFFGHILVARSSGEALSNDALNITSFSTSSTSYSEQGSIIVSGIATQLLDKKLPIEREYDKTKLPEKFKSRIENPYDTKHPIQPVNSDKTPATRNSAFASMSNARLLNTKNLKKENGSAALRNLITQTQNRIMDMVKSRDDSLTQRDSFEWDEINNSINAPSLSKSDVQYWSPFNDRNAIESSHGPYNHHGSYNHHGHHKYPHIVFTGRKILQEEGSGQECVIASNSGCGVDEQCIRRNEFDICECKKTHGRRHGHRERKCKPIKFNCGAVFKLVHKFRAKFKDQSSLEFLEFAQQFLDVIETDIQSNDVLDSAIVSTRITKCRGGSTTVHLSIDIGEDSIESQETIVGLLKKALVQVPPNDIGYSSKSLRSIKALSLCDQPETNPCSKNAECITGNDLGFEGCKCYPGFKEVSSSSHYPGAVCSDNG